MKLSLVTKSESVSRVHTEGHLLSSADTDDYSQSPACAQAGSTERVSLELSEASLLSNISTYTYSTF